MCWTDVGLLVALHRLHGGVGDDGVDEAVLVVDLEELGDARDRAAVVLDHLLVRQPQHVLGRRARALVPASAERENVPSHKETRPMSFLSSARPNAPLADVREPGSVLGVAREEDSEKGAEVSFEAELGLGRGLRVRLSDFDFLFLLSFFQ